MIQFVVLTQTIGVSPSGKALVSGTSIRGFESLHPSQIYHLRTSSEVLLFVMIDRMNIHFICRGNVLRSLIAETYLRSLNIDGVDVISSGTNVNWNDLQEREYFSSTLKVLKRHEIDFYAKSIPDQLDQSRIDGHNELTILMNQRVIDEATKLVNLPSDTLNWAIVDIGEGHRTNNDMREQYEEEIYKEITNKVDALFSVT